MTRVLVLGSAPHSRNVDAYAWDALPASLTVADYDVVIINLVTLGDDALCARCDLTTFPSNIDYGKLIFSNGSRLIFIGSPASIEIELRPQPGVQHVSCIDPKTWLPMAPIFQFGSGEEIRGKAAEYEWYFEKVRRWSFYADDHFPDTDMPPEWFKQIGFSNANVIKPRIGPIAETRFHRAIAFVIRYELWSIMNLPGLVNRGRQRKEKISDSGAVIWLPPPTEMTDYEAVNLILTERFKIGVEKESPAWVDAYTLPRQVEAKSHMDRIRQQAKEIILQLAAAETKFEQECRPYRLIYEQGDSLEEIVWHVLEELGATVERPKERGKHDGRLIDPNGRLAVIEIKGLTKNIGVTAVRQCENWKQDAKSETEQEYKGLLVCNAYCEMPLDKRVDWFAANAVDLAEKYEISLIKTSSLFRAIQDFQDGTFDQEAFWDAVFSANGVCVLEQVR